jgi:hypothetical protein
MNLYKYLSAAQVADLKAFSKAMEEAKNMNVDSVPLDLSSFTLDSALTHHIWAKP